MSTLQAERRLILLGAVLVLLAMLTGLLVGPMPHVRLVLSAHLAATMSGTLMIAVGAALSRVALGDGERTVVVWGLAASGYLNWVATLVGAALGTNALTPVHGAGTAGIAAEAVVAAVLVVMVLGTLGALGVLVRGAARAPA